MAVLPLVSLAVTVKVPVVPTLTGEGKPLTDRVVAGPATTRVPVAVAVPVWQPAPVPAVTVNAYEVGGVALGPLAVVVMVKVELALPPVLVREVGLNTGLAPVGGAGAMLRGDVQELPFPLKFTVTA